MPGKVKVKIIAGRNLPVMDRSSDTTDAYVEIKLGGTTYKTDVCRKSLHPYWNSEWYRFEVDDSELQDEPLQMRLMDHDTYSANDAIGKVYLNLNPLLLPSCVPMMKYGSNSDSNKHDTSNNSVLSGWIPVYDTMHGIRGEVNVIVKVELFSDFNKFRQSSCGVQFFYSPCIPHGYYAQAIYGFVEELVVSDDPEYQWIDKIRTPRASNEARQTLFFKLSGELQRKIGVKALELGANSVIGYRQCFDLEGESGIVARGIGTAAFLVQIAHTAENEEHYQSYLNQLYSTNSFRLKVEPFNNKYPFPSQKRNKLLSSMKINQSQSFDQPFVMSKPITLVKGSSLKSLLDQEDKRYSSGIGFSQRVRNFKYNFIKDKDPAGRNRNFPCISKRKLFAKKSERSSVMAEMLARSVLDCHSNLAPVIEHQDSGASDKSVSEKHSLSLSLSESVSVDEKSPLKLNIPEDSVDFSTQDSMSTESSSSGDISDINEMSNIVDDTISDIIRNLEMPKKTRYLTRQLSLSMNDLTSEYGSSLFSTGSRGFNENKLCDSNLNLLNSFAKDDISIYSQLTNKKRILSRSDNVLCVEKRELFLPKASSYLQVGPIKQFICEDRDEHRISGKFDELTKFEKESDVNKHVNIFENPFGDDIVLEPSEELTANSCFQSYRKEDPKLILPPIEIKGNLEKQSLVKTAMQTILLEKANIMGSYTPPVSPTVRVADTESPDLKIESSTKCFSFPHVDPPNEIKKCKPRGEQETVLGIRFQSISTTALSKYSKKHSFLSDRVLNKPITDFEKLKYKVSKTKSCFPSIVHVDGKKNSRKNSLIQKLQYTGMKRMSLFSKKNSANTLKHQRSFSSDAITPKNSFNKSYHIPKMFSRLSLFKQKEKKKDRSQSVFYVNDIEVNSDAGIDAELISPEISPPPSPPISELTPNIISDDDSLPIFNSECGNLPNNKHASSALSTRYNPPPLPDSFHADHHRSESIGTKISYSPAKLASIPSIHRRSSDSDLSITPRGNSLSGSDRSGYIGHALKPGMILRSVAHQDSFDMLEYPFLTISKYPPGFILHLGGAVSARSVKLLERISNIEEPESRDSWWSEVRMEIRSHARALNCNAVLGYTEICSICEDICVLSASGTAAVIGFSRGNEVFDNIPTGLNRDISLHDKTESDRDRMAQKDANSKSQTEVEQENILRFSNTTSCMICHLPYSPSMQLRSNILKCSLCRIGKVPEVLITTIEATDGIPTLGRGCLLQASVHRPLKDLKGEYNAKQISDGLPFLEYELHRILVNKLKIKGMNAVFSLKVRISIGEKMLIGVATGTAVFLTPLHCPTLPKLISDRTVDEKKLADLQRRLKDTVKRNKEIYQLKNEDIQIARITVDDESEEESASLELSLGTKECCLLEVDDPDDAEILNLLMEVCPPNGIHIVNTEFVPGLEELEIVKNLQMFKQIYRSKIHHPFSLNQHFQKLLQCIYFKLRRMVPCAVCDLQFRVDVPEGDEVQICVLGMALGLGDSQKLKLKRKNTGVKHDDLIFNLEEVNIPENSVVNTSSNITVSTPISKNRQKSPLRSRVQNVKQQHIPYRERYGVDITPLTYIPGGKIEKYLGNLNLFLVRETSSLREEGGPSGFVHSFATEVLAIVRAHVTALGGNGMVSYFLTECVLNYNLHKNQGQCLINVGGDVVFVSYFKEE